MSASTITLNGLTTHDYGTYYPYFAIRNDSGGIVYASTTDPECTPDTEGVVTIANGDGYMAANTDNDNTCLYLSGTGKVTVIAQHDKIFPFEKAQGGGDSGTASGSVVGLQIEKCVDELVSACVSVSTLPYKLYWGTAIVFNNEIHILGGSVSQTAHYKYNGSSWESVSTLPYDFGQGGTVVFNNEIHILGGIHNRTAHYKYNGSSWEEVSTLPYDFYRGSAVVFNNEIHILGGSDNTTKHYKYNGSSWESVSTLPYDFSQGGTVVYGNNIHILGGNSSNYYTNWYAYNSTSGWYKKGTLPYDFCNGNPVVFEDRIHILGSSHIDWGYNHYLYIPGSGWCNASTLSPKLAYPDSAVVFNNEIYFITDNKLNIVKNDNRHIATMLPKGSHIMLSDNEDINYVSNATKVSSNVAEVTETGYVELLASMPEIYAAKGYLTFY